MWLQQWKRDTIIKPHEIIVDDSAALLKSAVETFTTCNTTKAYIESCFNILSENDSSLPECYVRFVLEIYYYFGDISDFTLFNVVCSLSTGWIFHILSEKFIGFPYSKILEEM